MHAGVGARRYADTRGLNLSGVGVATDAKGKLICGATRVRVVSECPVATRCCCAGDMSVGVDNEQTNVPHIYAVGDCIAGVPELTPAAIKVHAELVMYFPGRTRVSYCG